jgi:hypothetical protein
MADRTPFPVDVLKANTTVKPEKSQKPATPPAPEKK